MMATSSRCWLFSCEMLASLASAPPPNEHLDVAIIRRRHRETRSFGARTPFDVVGRGRKAAVHEQLVVAVQRLTDEGTERPTAALDVRNCPPQSDLSARQSLNRRPRLPNTGWATSSQSMPSVGHANLHNAGIAERSIHSSADGVSCLHAGPGGWAHFFHSPTRWNRCTAQPALSRIRQARASAASAAVALALQCPACHEPVTPASRFCSACGFALVAAAPSPPVHRRPPLADDAGERRHATIAFSDLSGYTTLNERLDPEEVEALMGRIKREAVSHHRAAWRHRQPVRRRRGDGAVRCAAGAARRSGTGRAGRVRTARRGARHRRRGRAAHRLQLGHAHRREHGPGRGAAQRRAGRAVHGDGRHGQYRGAPARHWPPTTRWWSAPTPGARSPRCSRPKPAPR